MHTLKNDTNEETGGVEVTNLRTSDATKLSHTQEDPQNLFVPASCTVSEFQTPGRPTVSTTSHVEMQPNVKNTETQTNQTQDEATIALRTFKTLREIDDAKLKQIFSSLVSSLESQLAFPDLNSLSTFASKLKCLNSFVVRMRDYEKIGAALSGILNIGARPLCNGMRLFGPIVIMAIAEAELNTSDRPTSTFPPILRTWYWISTPPKNDEDEIGGTKSAVHYIKLLSTIGNQEPVVEKRTTIKLDTLEPNVQVILSLSTFTSSNLISQMERQSRCIVCKADVRSCNLCAVCQFKLLILYWRP